jgi:site-specific DNA recombinase
VKTFFAYVRVSTVRQGERGVSLQEQRDAIARYASRNSFAVAQWFEERETAAKRGRPIFTQMLKLLQANRADGVIIHKIDRSARNLKDWADLGELIDRGVTVQFANESLDLNSRGGRLSADIQAVVAADFIRNLREETRKGINGRLKQGLYPREAPVGYRDTGGGKAKVPDPTVAPLVRQTFELYATRQYTLRQLREKMTNLGLRNKRGSLISLNGISALLNNPFYIGLIEVKSTGAVFKGVHKPLIAVSLFQRVQAILKGKTNPKTSRHDFLFRRLLTCGTCGRSLIGERQKGNVYYRCQTRTCPVTCVREESVDQSISDLLLLLKFSAAEREHLAERLPALREENERAREAVTNAMDLHLAQLKDRLIRLTDAYIDRMIEKDVFESRKASLLIEQQKLEEERAEIDASESPITDRVAEFLELAGDASFLYKMALREEKRDSLQILTSNRKVCAKKIELTLFSPFQQVANRDKNESGSPHRYIPRTFDEMLGTLVVITRDTPLEFFSRISEFLSLRRKEDPTPSSSRFHQASNNNGNVPAS